MQWMDFIFEKRPYLKEYTRNIHDQDINLFKEKDKIKFDLSKMYIKEKLTNLRPVLDMQTAGSPAKLIEREYEKKRKLKPIRTIMTEIPEFIQLIKPCFLMSPLSVSTYLPEFMEFDVVIFDEASQVFPEDAIGAIYRSKQLIVVGDSKQMPPSNFFSASDNTNDEFEEDETDIDAYESILDLCSGILPKKSLLYHYRSKDESLITFSNKNFYGFNLVTFPSTNIEKTNTGIDFEYLNDGVYDQISRTNLKEALKIVELVYDHYRKNPERSLGVVAFNIAQQNLIIKLLSKRREYDPSLEEFFRDDRNEPFFVKNLETVQGDERDTIIFSITYGYDSKGQFALRFGPLNLVGGERRLNVAITRAKLNVKIVSSIKAQDIDVSRVTNSGPKLLRDYLDYCQNGVIESHKEENVVINESSFISDICDFLKEKGFETDINVGYSKFKVDIALKDLETNNYVLAIQCDGSSYQRFNSARDRDRLHQSVLEGMNWNFYRIWSTDWFSNNKRESKMLIEACHNALKKKGE
jgi:superfamily I DNA and/or RNA helicase